MEKPTESIEILKQYARTWPDNAHFQNVLSYISHLEAQSQWQPIGEQSMDVLKPPFDGMAVDLYAKEFINDEFNPSGVVDGFFLEGLWFGAIWSEANDHYQIMEIRPTHWRPKQGPNEGTP